MDLTELRKKILEHFGSEEFKTVCLDFKVANPSLTFDYDTHLAKSLNYEEIVQETVKRLSRESKLLDFVAFLKKERPDVDFNTFYSRLTSPTNPPINPIQTFLEKVKQDNEYLSPFRAIKMAEGFIPLYALQKMEAEKTIKESQEKQKSKPGTDETAGGGNSSTESEPQNNQQSAKNQSKAPPPTPPPIPLEAQKVALEHDQLLILGGSGMGKSTFLRYLAYQEASKPNGLIPIFAPLKEYTDGLLLQFCLHQAAPEDEALREMLNRQANDRKVWWLLDGLDEAHDKQKILDRAKGLPGKVTITSRPDDSYSFTSSKQFVLRSLNLQDIKQFLLQYFSADFSPADGEERVSKTIQNAQNNPAFRRLLESPLLLTFWADINRNTKVQNLSLPTQEVELYDSYLTRITQQEVTRHNSLPHYKDKQLDPDLMQKTFYGLGFILHNHKSNSPTAKEVEKILLEYLKGLNVDNLLTAQKTIEFWLGTGLLRQALKGEPPQPFLAFQHQSFQEYAVACFLHQAWQKDPNQTWQLLAPQHKKYPYATRLHHPAWQEPLRLLAQKMSGEELENFITRLWQHPSPDEKYLHRDIFLFGTLLQGNLNKRKKWDLLPQIISKLDRIANNYYGQIKVKIKNRTFSLIHFFVLFFSLFTIWYQTDLKLLVTYVVILVISSAVYLNWDSYINYKKLSMLVLNGLFFGSLFFMFFNDYNNSPVWVWVITPFILLIGTSFIYTLSPLDLKFINRAINKLFYDEHPTSFQYAVIVLGQLTPVADENLFSLEKLLFKGYDKFGGTKNERNVFSWLTVLGHVNNSATIKFLKKFAVGYGTITTYTRDILSKINSIEAQLALVEVIMATPYNRDYYDATALNEVIAKNSNNPELLKVIAKKMFAPVTDKAQMVLIENYDNPDLNEPLREHFNNPVLMQNLVNDFRDEIPCIVFILIDQRFDVEQFDKLRNILLKIAPYASLSNVIERVKNTKLGQIPSIKYNIYVALFCLGDLDVFQNILQYRIMGLDSDRIAPIITYWKTHPSSQEFLSKLDNLIETHKSSPIISKALAQISNGEEY